MYRVRIHSTHLALKKSTFEIRYTLKQTTTTTNSYKDGAVIVGGVDGNRLWGKELGMDLALVEWSPDGRSVLFVSQSDEVFLYDAQGNRISNIELHISNASSIVALDWNTACSTSIASKTLYDVTIPNLAIATENGHVQLTRGHSDENPVLITTGLKRVCACKWNAKGDVLAVAGTQSVVSKSTERRQEMSMILFYTPNGQHLRTLKVSSSPINTLSWERSGLRIALTVENYIFFANVRPDYKWAFFSNTLVYVLFV